jgi:hypothetical protein
MYLCFLSVFQSVMACLYKKKIVFEVYEVLLGSLCSDVLTLCDPKLWNEEDSRLSIIQVTQFGFISIYDLFYWESGLRKLF